MSESDTTSGSSPRLTARRAHLVLKSALEHGASNNVALAAAVTDDGGDLICCVRTDDSPLDHLTHVIGAATDHDARLRGPATSPEPSYVVVEVALPHPTVRENGEGLGRLFLAGPTADCAQRIAAQVIGDVARHDERHLYNISS